MYVCIYVEISDGTNQTNILAHTYINVYIHIHIYIYIYIYKKYKKKYI